MPHVAVLVPGIWNTKKRRADPSFGDSSLFHPTSPPIHFFLVVQMLSNSNLLLLLTFTLGVKCPGFFLRFMWERMSIRRELPYITPFFISLLDIITVDQYHIITFDQFNIITLAVKESFSANQYRQDQWTVRFGVPWHVILNLSMSPDTIRAIYLGPLHFVDYDG